MTLASMTTQGWAQAPTPTAPQTTGAPQQTQPTGTQPQTGAPQGQPAQTSQQTGSQVNPTTPAAPEAVQNDTTGQPGLPQAPQPKEVGPLYQRPTTHDYSVAKPFLPNPLRDYTPTDYPATRLSNTPRLNDLLRDGKVYLSLADAVTLALENNYDIAIARINLDIADTDILRAKAGQTLRGVSTGLVANTLGGTTSTITGGGGPGGTANGAGGGGTGSSGLVLSTNGGGPLPEQTDPVLAGTVEYEHATTPSTSSINPTSTSNTFLGNFTYTQGFSTGTSLNVGFDNQRLASNSRLTSFSPALSTSL